MAEADNIPELHEKDSLWPLYQTLTATALTYAAIVFFYRHDFKWDFYRYVSFYILVVFGIVYTHYFEGAYHEKVMHCRWSFRGWPSWTRWFTFVIQMIIKAHRDHHRWLCGPEFRTHDKKRLQYIAAHLAVFPLLAAPHLSLMHPTFPPNFIVGLFTGIVLYYGAYQTTHWCVHNPDTPLERFILKTPLRGIWEETVENHRKHHEDLVAPYNVVYPHGWDHLCSLLRRISK